MIWQAQLKFLSPLVQITPCPQKLNMHITGMGRFFRHIAHFNALQFTPKRKRERRTDQNPAFHGPKILLAHFFLYCTLWLRKFPANYSLLSLHSTRTSDALAQALSESVRMATLAWRRLSHARFRPLLRLCLAMCSSAFSSWPMVFRAQSLLMATCREIEWN